MIDKALLKKEQLKLAKEVVLRDGFDKVKLIAGADQSFIDNNSKVISSIVVCNYKTMEIVEKKYSVVDSNMSYVPGFVGYREGPAIVDAFGKLENKPDLLILDGNGILHPRRFGLASHVGLLLDISTIGVARNLMCGDIQGGKVYLGNDLVGVQVKTKEHGNPVFVSPGNKISIGSAIDMIQHSIKPPHKLPEPLHQAHKYSRKLQKSLDNGVSL